VLLPALVPLEPTQTVTEPDPRLEPCCKPEPEDPPLEQAIATWASKTTRLAAISTPAKLKLPFKFFLMERKLISFISARRSFAQKKNPIQRMGFF
jgi:hypothetical protein